MYLFHSVIMGLYPFVSVLEFNWNDVYLSDLLRSLPPAFAVLILLLFVWRLVTPSLMRASAGTTISFLLVLAYGPLTRWWRGDERVPGAGMVDLHFQSKEIVTLVILAASLALLAMVLRRIGESAVRSIVTLLNYFAIVLAVMSLGSILQKSWRESSLKFPPVPVAGEVHFSESTPRPDIYYIILDGFAGENVLRKIYGLEPVLADQLRSSGFYIAREARSNYFRTNYSLVSSLNMSYLHPPLVPESIPRMGFSYLRERLQHNAVRQILEGAGYTTVGFETGYRTTEWRDASRYAGLTEWNRVIATSASYVQLPFIREVISRRLHEMHRERTEQIFPRLLEEARTPGPKFVFAHVMAPHPPFVFEEDGSLYLSNKVFTLGDGDDYGGAADYRARYRAQAAYISKRVAAFAEELLSRDPGAYVVIQGDHGPGLQFDRSSLEATDVEERFSILNAVFFPGHDYTGMYPAISPVNTFRVILNRLTGANLPLLPDQSFFAEAGAPFSFIDVTSRLKHEQ